MEVQACNISDTAPSDVQYQVACFESLTEALGYVQQYHYHSTAVSVAIHLYSSAVTLEFGANNTVNNSQIQKLSLQSPNGSVVHCIREAGINFTGCGMNVSVKMITFVGCSRYGSLFFEHYHPYIEMVSVTVNMSNGIGLAFVNTTGNVVVNDSNIINTHTSQSWFGPITGLNIWSELSPRDCNLSFVLNNCHFVNNSATCPSVLTVSRVTRGGGMYINLDRTQNDNHIVLNNCTFTGNSACLGGGLSLKTSTLSNSSIEIVNCNFYQNVAVVGSAIDLFCSLSPIHRQYCSVAFKNSNFTNNSLTTEVIQMSSSTINTNNIHLILDGYVSFANNIGTALAAIETYVEVLEQSCVSFVGNSAQHGGALNLASSFVTLGKNTHLLFCNNSALDKGGAIFSNQRFDLYVPYSHNCFIRYTEN